MPESASGTDNLRTAKQLLNAGGIQSGGHVGCAANAGLDSWLRTIAQNPDAVIPYAKLNMGDTYDQTIMDQVIENAAKVVASNRYANWNENVLVSVLGDEAGDAIERLGDVPHEGFVVERQKRDGYTIDQTTLYDKSVIGKGSFNFDDSYAAIIENIMISGPDAATKKQVAEHAREAIIAAIAGAVPNQELYQDIIS